MCMTPVTLTRAYRKIGERWENAATNVPCGKCPICLKRRSNAWAFRLYEEMKISLSASFVTLTYENTPLTGNGFPTLSKPDFQKFMKRLRKRTKNKLKYYACGEYGSHTKRPHYHAILFNLDGNSLYNIEKAWPLGHVRVDECNMATIKYVTKYIMKSGFTPEHCEETGLIDDRIPEFSLMSKKLGLCYLTKNMVKFLRTNELGVATLKGGQLIGLPRYFKKVNLGTKDDPERLFTKEQQNRISKEMKELAELKMEEIFDDAYHQLEWKRDLLRKEEKKKMLERAKI